MKHCLTILLLFFLSLYVSGCPGSNPSDNSEESSTVNGVVVNIDNIPVSNADIHYYFYPGFHFAKIGATTNPTPSTKIGFSIPESSKVVIHLLQLGTRKHIRTLKDSVYSVGNYSLNVDLSILTNGFYIYQIIINGSITERILVNINYDLDQLFRSEPLTRTNESGKFTIPMSVLGIGQYIYMTGESNPTIIDSIKVDSIAIVVHKQGKFLIEGFRVNETQSITRSFILK